MFVFPRANRQEFGAASLFCYARKKISQSASVLKEGGGGRGRKTPPYSVNLGLVDSGLEPGQIRR